MSNVVLVIKDGEFSTKDATKLENVLSKTFGYMNVESKPSRAEDCIWEFSATGREVVEPRTRSKKDST